MKNYYIFSEMNGCYSYEIIIVEANSLQEAINKADIANRKVRDHNYDPKLDPDKGITENWESRHLFTEEEHKILGVRDSNKVNWLINNYDRMLEHSHYACQQGISGNQFLRTNVEGWFDWIEMYGNLPDGYKYKDGHGG